MKLEQFLADHPDSIFKNQVLDYASNGVPIGYKYNGISIDCSMNYINIDTIARLVKANGQNSLMALLDLEDAYKHIVVRPEDWDLLGSTWKINSNKVYFKDTVLPFGLKSAAKLFNLFADALEYSIKKQGCSIVTHYLDDFAAQSNFELYVSSRCLLTLANSCSVTGSFCLGPSLLIAIVLSAKSNLIQSSRELSKPDSTCMDLMTDR